MPDRKANVVTQTDFKWDCKLDVPVVVRIEAVVCISLTGLLEDINGISEYNYIMKLLLFLSALHLYSLQDISVVSFLENSW
jgi:hypothetical protein